MSAPDACASPLPEQLAPTPPLTPPSKSAKLGKEKEEVPADINIPDNYVAWTLKNQKALPPVSWDNWWKELNYLSLAILTITPGVAIWGACTHKLRWETFLFSVFYYYVTGLGECIRSPASYMPSLNAILTTGPRTRHHGWVPPAMGAPVIQRVKASAVLPRNGWRRCGRGFDQVVVAWPPGAPSIHGHGSGPV